MIASFNFGFWFSKDKPPPQDSQGPFPESPYTPHFLSFCLSLSLPIPTKITWLRPLFGIPWAPWAPWAFHCTNPLALVSVLTHEVLGTTGNRFSRYLCYLVMELGIVQRAPFSLMCLYKILQGPSSWGSFLVFLHLLSLSPTLPPHSTLSAWKQYRPFLSYLYSFTWPLLLLVTICLFWTWDQFFFFLLSSEVPCLRKNDFFLRICPPWP